jgi:nitrogenase molybdenum-iron protein alpha chain
VSICGTHDDYFGGHLKEKYRIPFVIDTYPVGRKNTADWVRNIAVHFDLQKEAERLIAAENGELDRALEPYRTILKGKKAYLGGGELRIVATAEVVQDLGMEVIGFKAHHYDAFNEPVFKNLENVDDVLFTVATNQPFEASNILKRINPDILIMHTGGNNAMAKHGLPILPLFGPANNYMGFTGVFEIARRLAQKLRNCEYNKQLSLNRPLPFRKEWYGKDPFTYLKQ